MVVPSIIGIFAPVFFTGYIQYIGSVDSNLQLVVDCLNFENSRKEFSSLLIYVSLRRETVQGKALIWLSLLYIVQESNGIKIKNHIVNDLPVF